MKTLPFILGLIIIVLIGGIYVLVTELRDVNRVQQSTIDGLKRRNEAERDSLNTVIKLKDDTIRIAKFTILAQADTIKNQELEKENYKRNTHDKIRFIPFANDFQRDSVLTSLYPSFRPIR